MAERAKYVVVRDLLAERVRLLQPGDQLPSEGALCDEYGVSRITLRRAVEELIANGLLVRVQGRGTFVTAPPNPEIFREAFANRVRGFYRQQTAAGNRVETRVLRNSICQDATAAAQLSLPAAADLIQLDRVRLVNGVLQQVSTTWLEAARYPRVLVHDFSAGSLYEFLEETYGVRLARNDLVVKVGLATAELAENLRTEEGHPLLAMSSSVYAADDQPIAFGITHFAPENSEILISLRDSGELQPQLSAQISESSASAAPAEALA
jgi:GntR family transcriptional regulator